MVSRKLRRLVPALLAVAFIASIPHARAGCERLMPHAQARGPTRSIAAEDLIELRDIGQPDASIILPESPLAVSPDGRSVAFVLNRADLATNGYCRATVVLALAPGATPRAVDTGGELITATGVRRGLVERTGFPELIVPAWSPDGEWVAYLRRDHGRTQVWRARRSGGGGVPVSRSDADVESFAWSRDGRAIVYAARPAYVAERRAIDAEGRSGWAYDARFVPNWAMRPQESGPVPAAFFAVDLATGVTAPANAAQQAELHTIESRYTDRSSVATSATGWRAGTALSGTSPLSPLRLWIQPPVGPRRSCLAPACSGTITGIWWAADGRALWYLKREGWANGEMALYRLARDGAAPRRVFATQDLLQGCTLAGGSLLCLRENATTPRRLDAIDPDTGRTTLLFDPNPEFDRIQLGRVERLEWKNDLGLEAWGDLALPPDYRPRAPLPMVVVQYHSDGFLRGGTGDDYPIHLLAARGYAVLSFERPAYYASLVPNLRSYDDANAANSHDWADRRNVLSALETGVRLAIARGVADPKRIGITGLSDGATTARFALINSPLFAAAAISTCCMDPNSVMTYGGIAWAKDLQSEGYPPLSRDDPAFWKPFSTAVNAARLDVPILMQLADSEALLALESFTALRDHHQPVDLYVYPEEFHYKWQPVHRRAVYLRTIDWFDYWLRGLRSRDPDRAPELARWDALRDEAAGHR